MFDPYVFAIILALCGMAGFVVGSGLLTKSTVTNKLPPALQRPASSLLVSSASPLSPHTTDTTHQPGLSLQPAKRDRDAESSANASPSFTEPTSPSSLLLQMSATQSKSSDSDNGEKRNVIIVAKHLPIRVTMTGTGASDSDWSVEWEDSRSFLSNLKLLESNCTIHFVGLAHQSFIDVNAEVQAMYVALCKRHQCTPIVLPPAIHDHYLNGFCKSILWPMLHYVMPKPSDGFGELWTTVWDGYDRANQAIAEQVFALMRTPNDTVWIHNYHLLMLPGLIRRQFPWAKIGLFIHTPFPSSDIFRALPSRAKLLESMMANDLIGFHTFDYARHFLSCVKRVLDLDFETLPGGALGIKYSGRFVSILISHVGIASNRIREVSRSQSLTQRVHEIRAKFPGRKLLIGVDDLDAVKGPLLKIQAIDRFFTKYHDYINKVVFVEILFLSKNYTDTLGIQHDLLSEIERLKSKYGASIIHVIQPEDYVPVEEQVAWYRASHVAVVSTFWDGLNLMPYEYTASQDANDPGALIISEFMGCSRSLNGVIRVNPWSLESVADAIERSLTFTQDERKAMHARRYNYVMNHTIERWARGFLEQLDRAASMAGHLNFFVQGSGSDSRLVGLRNDFEQLNFGAILNSYMRCEKRILFLDYDGTLIPSEKKSGSGVRGVRGTPPASILRLLARLTEDPNNCVFLMSGRPRTTLFEWFGQLTELGLAAEKGLFLRWPKRLEKSCRMTWTETDAIAEDDTDDDESDSEAAQASENSSVTQVSGSSPKAQSAAASHKFIPHVKSASLRDSDWEHLVSLHDVSWKSLALDVIRSYTEQTDGSFVEDKEFAIIWHYELCDEEYGKMQATDLHKYLTKILNNPNVDVVKYDYSRIIEVKPHGVSKGNAATAICEALLNPRERELQLAQSQSSWSRAMTAPASAALALAQSKQPFAASAPFKPFHSDSQTFFLAVGDDRGDEDMFVAVQHKNYLQEKMRINRLKEQTGIKRTATTIEGDSLRVRRAGSTTGTSISASLGASQPIATSENHSDPNVWTVCVGQKPSAAHYYVDDDRAVVHLLNELTRGKTANSSSNTQSPRSSLPLIAQPSGIDEGVRRRKKQHGSSSVS